MEAREKQKCGSGFPWDGPTKKGSVTKRQRTEGGGRASSVKKRIERSTLQG